MRPCAIVCLLVASLLGSRPALARPGQPQYLEAQYPSALLTAFWGHPVGIRGYVLLPDSYYKEPRRTYPVLYWIQGFGGDGSLDPRTQLQWQRAMRSLNEQFILISLDGMFGFGDDVFADSANNGPWATALTREFIPVVETEFRATGTPATRFVAGHSSGGWAALWLQVTHPGYFGGEWSLSPDPVDFRNFTGPDLTRSPPQNFYKDDAGHGYVLDGVPLRSFVVGPGWERRQFESFDAVFSPRGADGDPEPLFDRKTGVIDPAVAGYWEAHYDIARILRDDWTTLGPELRGKLHIVVGTNDQFDLTEPVELLQKELDGLGSDAQISYVKGADHFTVLNWDGDAYAEIIREAAALASSSPATQTR